MSEAILVVDDDPQLRQLMRWALEDGGFQVETAADGRDALDRIAQAPPRVVVLDVTLPGPDGFAVADALRARGAERVPIVMITADGSAAEKAARMRAFAYLRKPFDMAALIAAIHQALGR